MRALLLALALAGSAPALAADPPGPQGVVLVLVDDLGWADLGCYGNRLHETPALDRLAAEGMLFTDAYAACAVCSPTRAAVQTGRYPARIGITDWIRARFQGGHLPPDGRNPRGWVEREGRPLACPENPLWLESEEVTLAEALAPAGFTSCHVGKWHLGLCAWYPTFQGYDENVGGCDFGQPPSYFDPYRREGQGDIPTLEPRRAGEYLTDREADEAVRFLRENRERSFFLHWAPYAVHTPLQAPEELIERYRGKPGSEKANPTYAAMVHAVDRGVGRVLSALDELELADRTLVIFTSDNGGLSGPTDNAPLRAGKGHPYEGGIRVPLIVRWPGAVVPGSRSSEPVSSIDLLPTVLEARGLELPEGREIDGLSLVDHLRSGGSEPLGREALFWHFPHYRSKAIGPYSVVRAGDHKLVKWWEGPRLELYDLASDPGEERDLAAEEPERVRALAELLAAHLASVGARLPRPR